MNAIDVAAWTDANQRHLVAALGLLKARLERHAGREGERQGSSEEAAERALLEAELEMPAPPALDSVALAFGLSPFEREVLLLCAGIELDGGVADLCAAAQGDRTLRHPTFGLALAALPGAHWSALAPSSPLRWWRLVEVDPRPSLAAGSLRIDERILHHLSGIDSLDGRLQGVIEPVPAADDLPASQAAVSRALASLWGDHVTPAPIVQLCGRDPGASAAVASAACRERGLTLHAIAPEDLPASPGELAMLRTLCEREAILSGSALLVTTATADRSDDSAALVSRFVDRLRGPVVVAARDPIPLNRLSVRLEVAGPSRAEQAEMWMRALGSRAEEARTGVERVVAQFDLGPAAIRAAAAVIGTGPPPPAGAGYSSLVWDACRIQSRTRLDDLAQRIEPAAGWEDLILPRRQGAVLREMVASARHRWLVYGAWGFARKGSRGLGLSALFSGPSGTGKTMAAEVIAGELRLDLYRIDLSSVVSKYIGDTEKNLRRVFDAAEEGGAILLFDEADALFGKRSEVRDSHDRYANIEVGYLLQRMEAYRGLAILTTNMKGALDPAFLRRIRFVVQFPFPDPAARAEIWRRIFPPETPTEGLDGERLAGLNVTGGSIRNIALGAAFLAAEASEPVRMSHVLQAARSEYVKLEKPLTDAEIGRR